MNIDFGVVQKYFSDRGFGFVTHTFLSGHQSEVFFHIKNVKRTHPDLAKELDNEEPIYFWYKTEKTSKGEQVCSVLQSDVIQNMVTEDLPDFVDKIEDIWNDIDSTVPVWLHDITVDLVGVDRASELSLARDTEEREKKEAEALQKTKEAMRLKLIEEQKIQNEVAKKEFEQRVAEIEPYSKQECEQLIAELEFTYSGQEYEPFVAKIESDNELVKEKEFKQLVAEMRPLRFTKSKEVSRYIVGKKLGYKYKNISGILEMTLNTESWDFEGGFPKDIYAKLCVELRVIGQGTNVQPGKFTPFKDL